MGDISQRKNPRRKVCIPVVYWAAEDEQRVEKGKKFTTKDLSSDGLAFSSERIFQLGTILIIEMFLPSAQKPISCKLNVVRVEALPH